MNRISIFQKKSAAAVTAVLCCVLWGSTFPALKLSYAHMATASVYQLLLAAGIRFTLAGLGILVFQKLKRKARILPQRRELPMILLMGVFQTFIAYVLYYIALANTTSVKSSVLASSGIFFTVMFASFAVKKDRPRFLQVVGMLLGFAGVLCANFTSLSALSFSFTFKGEGLLLIHCVIVSAFLAAARRYAPTADVVKMSGWQFFIGGVLLLCTGWIGGAPPLEMDAVAVGLLVYLAAISGVTITIWFILLKYHSIPMLEQYKFSLPMFGALISVLVLPDEHFGMEMLAAALLVAAGILIVNRAAAAQKRAPAEARPLPEHEKSC
jgi:drug/metabolite transporter (DMT)-like permease